MDSENLDSDGTLESLLLEIPTLKSQTEIVREVLQYLDINIGKRCRNITYSLVSQDLSRLGEKTSEIMDEYNALSHDVNKAMGKMFSLNDLKGSVFNHFDAQLDDDFSKRKTFKFLDQRRLSHNLMILIEMVEDFKEENKKLKIRNKLLTKEILAIVDALLAQMKDGGAVTVFDERESLATDEVDSDVMDEVLEQFTALKMNINQANYMFEETRSLSHEILRPNDASFILDMFETRILSSTDWKNSIAKLKSDHEKMVQVDKGLKEIKLSRLKKTQ